MTERIIAGGDIERTHPDTQRELLYERKYTEALRRVVKPSALAQRFVARQDVLEYFDGIKDELPEWQNLDTMSIDDFPLLSRELFEDARLAYSRLESEATEQFRLLDGQVPIDRVEDIDAQLQKFEGRI